MRDVNRKGINVEDTPPHGDQGKLPGEMEQQSHDRTPMGRRRGRGAHLRQWRKLKKKTHVFMVIYLLTKCQGISTEIGESF